LFAIHSSQLQKNPTEKFLRITLFDKNGKQICPSKIERESEITEDIHIRAFKLRREFPGHNTNPSLRIETN